MHGKRRTSRFSLLKTTSSKKRHKHIQALSLSLLGPKITTSTLFGKKHCHTFHLDVPHVIPLSFTVVAEHGPACAIVIFCLSFSGAVSNGPCQSWRVVSTGWRYRNHDSSCTHKQTWLRSSSSMGREGPRSRMAAVEKNRIVVGS